MNHKDWQKFATALFKKAKEQRKKQSFAPIWLENLCAAKLNKFLEQTSVLSQTKEGKKYLATLPNFTCCTPISLPKPSKITSGNMEKTGVLPPLINQHDFYNLVFVDGYYQQNLSTQTALPDGIILSSLQKAWQGYPNLIKTYLSKTYHADNLCLLTNLNLACLTSGMFFYVPEKVVLEKPIYLLFLRNTKQKNTLLNLTNVLIAENKSKVTVLEEYAALGTQPYANNVLQQVYLGEAAQINFYQLQKESKKAVRFAEQQIEQQAKSRFTNNQIAIGGLLVDENLQVTLTGKKASGDLCGLNLADDSKHHKKRVQVDHLVGQTLSQTLYKSMVNGKAESFFQGKIKVSKNAAQSIASLKNQNLLLSANAKALSQPELEIYADDVKCKHGATCGQLDAEALFYLRARGIAEPEAKQILIKAFLQEVIDKIEHPLIREYFVAQLKK